MNEEQQWTSVVRSEHKLFDVDIKGLKDCKDLIILLVRRTFVAKYKQTVLGPAWAIIQPFMTTVVYTIIFGSIAGLGADGVPNFIFFLSGNIAWQLFASTLTDNSGTFINNSAIFSKVYYPRLVAPITSALSQFITFFIQFAFMIIFLVYYAVRGMGVHPNIYMLMTPLILIQLAALGMGFGIIISSLTTKYKDLNMLVTFGVSLWSYASPVAYDMFSRSSLAAKEPIYYLYMCNPVTPIINVFRYAYLGTGEIDWMFYGISWITTIIVLFIGILLFGKVEKTFLDTV